MDTRDKPHSPKSRRDRISALLLALAVSAVALVSIASPAGAATFSANPATLGAIPDGITGPTPCDPGPPRNVEFNVSGLQAQITDVQVGFTLNPAAQWVGDLIVVLIAPGSSASQSIFGRTDVDGQPPFGDESDVLGPYTFADSAPALPKWWDAAGAVNNVTPIASGSYRASTPGGTTGAGSSTLITPTFAGLASPNGTWTLRFIDCAGGGSNPGVVSGFTGTVSEATLGISAPSIPPSNQFTFTKLKLNKEKGTATLTVDVPGPGNMALGGKGLVAQRLGGGAAISKVVAAAGKVKLKIKAKGAKKTKLNDKGKVTVRPKITFTPTGGTGLTQTKKIKLKKNL